MPVYDVNCVNCHYQGKQWLSQDVGSLVIKCPVCMRGVTVRKVKTKGIIEAEADGVTGYLAYDNKRHSDSSNS